MAEKNNLDIIGWGSLILAALTAFGGVMRIVLGKDVETKLSNTTLTYFAVAGAFLMLRQIKTLSFGDTKIELRDLEAKANQAMELAKTAVDASSVDAAPKSSDHRETPRLDPEFEGLKGAAESIKSGHHKNDPWKGQFGEQPERNGRRLSAQVTPIIDKEDYFVVRMMVESLDPSNPLTGKVQFFLHSSFRRNPIVPVIRGRAEFRVRSYGAFTVGVLADGGKTMLELDLAEDRSFPRKFRDS